MECKPHPQATKIEAMARATCVAFGVDPDERISHGWPVWWNPHVADHPSPRDESMAVPLGILSEPRWLQSAPEALMFITMLEASKSE